MKIAKIYFAAGNTVCSAVVAAGLGRADFDPRFPESSQVLSFPVENAEKILALKTGVSPDLVRYAVTNAK
jgi:phage tail protein X